MAISMGLSLRFQYMIQQMKGEDNTSSYEERKNIIRAKSRKLNNEKRIFHL